MAETVATLNLLLQVTFGLLALVVAAVVHALPPRSLPKAVLAVAVALIGFRSLGALLLVLLPDAAGAEAFDRAYFDLTLLGMAAFIAFLALYPVPARGWSVHTAILAVWAALVGITAAAWLVDPALLFDAPPGDLAAGPSTTLLYQATWGVTAHLVHPAAVASGLWRARALPSPERRAAFALLPLLALSPFTAIAGRLLDSPALLLQGGGIAPPAFLAYPGACCGLADAGFVLHAGLVLGIAAALAWKGRSHAALGLVAYGAVVEAALAFAEARLNVFPLALVIRAIAPMYVITRYGAFGTRPPPWGPRLVAGAVLVAVFLSVDTVLVGSFGDGPLVLSAAVFLGLALGGAAALAVLPRGWLAGPPPGDAATTERRLAPYRRALEAEMARGLGPDETSDRLRSLRAELGVSEYEHAAMAFALRNSGAEGFTEGAGLAEGQLFLGRYRVHKALGTGGAVTHLCRDEVVQRDVVLKAIRSPGRTTHGLQDVLREARAVGAIRHPNVVTLHDVQQVGHDAVIVMEHVEGGSLADRLQRGKLSATEFRAVAAGTLRALEAVHAAGIVHRDVKPSNILLAADGQPKLADFGIAHIPGFEATQGHGREGGAVAGTARFMSPEQAKGRLVTHRSDLFSAAATLFEAYTGEPYLAPRPGEGALEIQMRAAAARPLRRSSGGSAALQAWFARALQPSPELRHRDARAMREALERALKAAA